MDNSLRGDCLLGRGLPHSVPRHGHPMIAYCLHAAGVPRVRHRDVAPVAALPHACEPHFQWPHTHSDHVQVALSTRAVALSQKTVNVVLPVDPAAVEALHRLEGEPEADIVWSEVWPSAFAAADAILSGDLLLPQPSLAAPRVCELGAGVGLAGLAAALAWPNAHVLLTDREPRALWGALASAAANGLRIDASHLPAGLPPLPTITTEQAASCVSASLLDWNAPLAPHLRGQFDILLLCDVLYQPGSITLLAELVPQLLSPRGALLLADTAHRPGKEGLRQQFLDAVHASPRLSRRLRILSCRRVAANMPAPVLDVNTGDVHEVELLVMAPED